MLRFTRSLVVVCALTVLGSVALAQEMVDNPRYLAWTKFKPGTTVTQCIENTMKHVTDKTETTNKLVELTPEKVVVESTMTKSRLYLPGMTAEEKVQADNRKPVSEKPVKRILEMQAKVTKEDFSGAQLSPMPTEPGTKVLPDEDVTVAGKTYKCKVIQSTSDEEGTKISATFWTCPQVPGGVVKIERIRSGVLTGESKTLVTAIDVK